MVRVCFWCVFNTFYEYVVRVSAFVVVCVCVRFCACCVPLLYVAHYLLYEVAVWVFLHLACVCFACFAYGLCIIFVQVSIPVL